MDEKTKKQIELHTAGATVTHISPFSKLNSYKNEKPINKEFITQWVKPFYFELNNQSEEWIEKMIKIKPALTDQIILKNLGDFNWRTRSTGSYFASIKQAYHLEEIIGTHLLKSEVCYAGTEYAKTIAFFNTDKSAGYLNEYLRYYLKRPELYFDQESVMLALKYLDEINGSDHVSEHLKEWRNLWNWRNNYTYRNLQNLKKTFPEKSQEIELQLSKIATINNSIDTSFLKKQIYALKKITES
ncbi:conserved hypothetical protein [Tenacibaculum sp. 190524A02b]|uniref:Uncharacterized protein n=1 Tax=Tenacibaculum vairaonense TaxID=3137860 RepID=A0ABM9PH13_9FLAO